MHRMVFRAGIRGLSSVSSSNCPAHQLYFEMCARYNKGLFEDTVSLLKLGMNDGILSRKICNIGIRACGSAKNPENGEVIKDLLMQTMEDFGVAPTGQTLKLALHSLSRINRLEYVPLILKNSMHLWKDGPFAQELIILLLSEQLKNCEVAVNTLEHLKENQIYPSHGLLNFAVAKCASYNNRKAVVRILELMREMECRIYPETWNHLKLTFSDLVKK